MQDRNENIILLIFALILAALVGTVVYTITNAIKESKFASEGLQECLRDRQVYWSKDCGEK